MNIQLILILSLSCIQPLTAMQATTKFTVQCLDKPAELTQEQIAEFDVLVNAQKKDYELGLYITKKELQYLKNYLQNQEAIKQLDLTSLTSLARLADKATAHKIYKQACTELAQRVITKQNALSLEQLQTDQDIQQLDRDLPSSILSFITQLVGMQHKVSASLINYYIYYFTQTLCFSHEHLIEAMCYNHNNELLRAAFGYFNFSLNIWRDKEILRSIDRYGRVAAFNAAFNHDGTQIALINLRKIYIYDVATGARIQKLDYYKDPDRKHPEITFSPDNNHIALAHNTKIILYSLSTGECVREIPLPGTLCINDYRRPSETRTKAPVSALAFNSLGTQLAIGFNYNAFVHIIDSQTGEHITSLPCKSERDQYPQYPESVAFSPDNKYIAIGGDQFLSVRDIATDKHIYDAKARCKALTFNQDGKRLELASSDWRCTDMKRKRTLLERHNIADAYTQVTHRLGGLSLGQLFVVCAAHNAQHSQNSVVHTLFDSPPQQFTSDENFHTLTAAAQALVSDTVQEQMPKLLHLCSNEQKNLQQ